MEVQYLLSFWLCFGLHQLLRKILDFQPINVARCSPADCQLCFYCCLVMGSNELWSRTFSVKAAACCWQRWWWVWWDGTKAIKLPVVKTKAIKWMMPKCTAKLIGTAEVWDGNCLWVNFTETPFIAVSFVNIKNNTDNCSFRFAVLDLCMSPTLLAHTRIPCLLQISFVWYSADFFAVSISTSFEAIKIRPSEDQPYLLPFEVEKTFYIDR